jgi:hypothetical protein
LGDIAPNLTAAVPKRVVRQYRVCEGLPGGWPNNVPPDLGAPAIRESFEVVDCLVGIALTERVEDAFHWGWKKDYSYSTHSCYRAMFGARVEMASALQI